MSQPFFSIFAKSALLAFESQQVIALRMMRIAGGGAGADREMKRMFSEKAFALAELGFAAAVSMASGKSGETTALGVVRGYRKRVRDNHRRLLPK